MSICIVNREITGAGNSDMYAAFIDRIHRSTSPAGSASCNPRRKKNGLMSSPSPNRALSPKSPKSSAVNRKLANQCSPARAQSPLANENSCLKPTTSSSSSNLVTSVQTLSLEEAKQCQTEKAHFNNKPANSASAITSPELAGQVAANHAPIMLDCRSFISFNLCHIRGAINVGCADRVTKRRLATGKLGVADLIKCPINRELFQNNQCADVIVYDDESVNVDPAAASCSAGSMPLVVKALVAKHAKVHFLKGEIIHCFE